MAVTTAIAAVASAGAAVYSATQSPPKPPAPQQEAKAPGMDAFRNRNRQSGPTPKAGIASLLSGDGSAGGIASSSLLGQ